MPLSYWYTFTFKGLVEVFCELIYYWESNYCMYGDYINIMGVLYDEMIGGVSSFGLFGGKGGVLL